MITRQRAITTVEKLGLKHRKGGGEIFYRYFYEEQLILTTAIPKGHGPLYCEDKVRKQLCLDRDQFEDAKKCPFKEHHFVANLKRIGRIREKEPDEERPHKQARRASKKR